MNKTILTSLIVLTACEEFEAAETCADLESACFLVNLHANRASKMRVLELTFVGGV